MDINNLESLIGELIEKYNLKEVQEKLLKIQKEKIDVKIALLGEFSSGKTTLINALIGKKLLPSFSEPTTAIITEILKGEENKCYILSTDELGEEVKKEISFGEIASEVTRAENNKQLIVELNDVEFLNEGFKIIDTPGVSSIENMHEDITYGYLPLVDVVFLLLNIQSGTISKSLMDFLKKMPKEQLTKMYFVLNFKDILPPRQIERVKKSFEDGLSKVIETPNIIIISAMDALNGKLENNLDKIKKSGVECIEEIIKNEIVTYKREIEEKKLFLKYKDILLQINTLLKFKIENLEWDTEEDNKAIRECELEIKKIKKDIENIEKEFENIKEDILTKSKELVNNTVSTIAIKAMLAERENIELNLDVEINDMVVGIEDIVNSGISRIKKIKIDSINSDLGTIISNSINSEVSKIKDIADMITNIATFIATAVIIPGANAALDGAAGVAIVAAEKSGKGAAKKAGEKAAKNLKFLKGMKFVSDALNDVNPLEKIKQFTLPYIINPKLKGVLEIKIINSLDCIFNQLEQAINDEIENNYVFQIKQKEEVIKDHIANKTNMMNNIEQLKKDIDEDKRKIMRVL